MHTFTVSPVLKFYEAEICDCAPAHSFLSPTPLRETCFAHSICTRRRRQRLLHSLPSDNQFLMYYVCTSTAKMMKRAADENHIIHSHAASSLIFLWRLNHPTPSSRQLRSTVFWCFRVTASRPLAAISILSAVLLSHCFTRV